MSKLLKFEGHNYLRQRLILATLSGKVVRIDKIRSDDHDPGIRDHEANFLRLLEKVTNGSTIEINYTGTSVLYKPGAIQGGRIEHDCGTDRSISYYLEPMIALAPFSKKPFMLVLRGITTDHIDNSVSTHQQPIVCILVPNDGVGGYHSYSIAATIKTIWDRGTC